MEQEIRWCLHSSWVYCVHGRKWGKTCLCFMPKNSGMTERNHFDNQVIVCRMLQLIQWFIQINKWIFSIVFKFGGGVTKLLSSGGAWQKVIENHCFNLTSDIITRYLWCCFSCMKSPLINKTGAIMHNSQSLFLWILKCSMWSMSHCANLPSHTHTHTHTKRALLWPTLFG